jgi:hypothetical protein
MYRLSALALFATSAAFAAPVPKGEKKELYFPTTVGAKWVTTMTMGDRTSETTETVTKVEAKGGVYTVTVEVEAKGGAISNNFRVSDKEVARLRRGGGEDDLVPLLRLAGKVGDKWELAVPAGKTPGARAKKLTYTLGKEEEVKVPAGTFKAIRVDFEAEQQGRVNQKDATWYAPGVGLVKAIQDIGGKAERTVVLKSFTPGKEEKKDEPKKDK